MMLLTQKKSFLTKAALVLSVVACIAGLAPTDAKAASWNNPNYQNNHAYNYHPFNQRNYYNNANSRNWGWNKPDNRWIANRFDNRFDNRRFFNHGYYNQNNRFNRFNRFDNNRRRFW